MSSLAPDPFIADPEPPGGEIPMDGPGAPATEPGALGGLLSAARRALTAGLVMTVTLIAFEALAISTVMPVVAGELGGLDLYGWVFSIFFLGSLVGIVVVGGLIDRGGLVLPLAVGLGLFSIGLAVGGLAPSMPVLVAGRLFQGLGAGAIFPIAYVSIGRALPEELRPRMFAILSTAWVLPGVIGPAIAGVVAERISWRAVFLGLLPLIVLAAVVTLPAIRAAVPSGVGAKRAAANGREADRGAAHGSTDTELRRRLPLALVLALGAALLVAGLASGTLLPGGPVVLGGVLLVLPTFRRLTPSGTLRAARGLPAAILLRGVLTFAFFCADAYVTLALQHWRGLSPSVAGIALTGATLSWAGGAWVQARRFEALGARRLVRSGFAVVVLGIAGFALVLVPTAPVVIGLAAWTVAGFGMGIAYAPLSLTVLREAEPGAVGAAASGLQLSDVLGIALGTGVGGALVAIGARAGLDPWVGLLGAFAVGAAVGLAGLAVAGRLEASRAGDSG